MPRVHLIAPLGILSALGLMVTLPISTWIRMVIWLAVGLVIFFTYARRNGGAKLARLAEEAETGSA